MREDSGRMARIGGGCRPRLPKQGEVMGARVDDSRLAQHLAITTSLAHDHRLPGDEIR